MYSAVLHSRADTALLSSVIVVSWLLFLLLLLLLHSFLLSCSQYLTMRVGCHADTKRRQNQVTNTYVSQTRPTSMSANDLRLLDSSSSLTRTAGVAQWLECRTRDRKVAGSSPSTSDRRIFFSRVNSLC